MAQTKKKNSTTAKRQSARAKAKTAQRTAPNTGEKRPVKKDNPLLDEIILIITLVVSLLLILSYLTLGGLVSDYVNHFIFGMMGIIAYLFPFALFFGVAFGLSNRGNKAARRKIISSVLMLTVLSGLVHMWFYPDLHIDKAYEAFHECADSQAGGGLIGSYLSSSLVHLFDKLGTYLILVALLLILIVIITEQFILSNIRRISHERYQARKLRREEDREYALTQEKEGYRPVAPKRKAKTYTFLKERRPVDTDESASDSADETPVSDAIVAEKDTSGLFEVESPAADIDALDIPIQRAVPSQARTTMPKEPEVYEKELQNKFSHKKESSHGFDSYEGPVELIRENKHTKNKATQDEQEAVPFAIVRDSNQLNVEEELTGDKEATLLEQAEVTFDEVEGGIGLTPYHSEEFGQENVSQNGSSTAVERVKTPGKTGHSGSDASDAPIVIEQVPIKEYEFPPIRLLVRPKGVAKGQTDKELKETALKLQQTLESFGVRVTITNVSCGPAVTRYELQPEQGVKVSRITNLADDIKLNLAAADVRIEAPIPGKAAVGIEVPNKVNSMVTLRELIESEDFTEHKSDIAFAVGKDIGGQTVITDIAKMPHLLIAGATGSGKSVCINTLIMSILYKAKPDDVKLIMIDPKVVELSVYNGIPHLLIPVVTDPKKASGALNWAVAEMTDRYKKFAELGVRDIKGYNQKIGEIKDNQDPNYKKLPQIVIIVDELADLMMVAPGEVEEAICRLAQMARAAGLHLIIATQRPSVNVITGLIKANVPSRIAFSVSSAIDSRTIIDGSGAEKLLGKGDMLFFPSGYAKPVRIQGAFVSDKEVSSVVEFLSTQTTQTQTSTDIESQITNHSLADTGTAKDNERDEYFVEAGRIIIDKDKASIGMLQRMFKIGFNRAARIMDQLCEAGVVGPEEGTKPRKVLMSPDEFENYVEECV